MDLDRRARRVAKDHEPECALKQALEALAKSTDPDFQIVMRAEGAWLFLLVRDDSPVAKAILDPQE